MISDAIIVYLGEIANGEVLSDSKPSFLAPNYKMDIPTAARFAILHFTWLRRKSSVLPAPIRRINSAKFLPYGTTPHAINESKASQRK